MASTREATMARPLRLHHHAFVVRDQLATRRFYEEIIGLPLVATWGEEEDFGHGPLAYCHTFYEVADGSCLAFFQFASEEAAKQFGQAKPPSPFDHVALLATTELQDQVAARAADAGLQTKKIDHGYCVSLYIPDPDGLLIELVVDAQAAIDDSAMRREAASAELERWCNGDHRPNNTYRA